MFGQTAVLLHSTAMHQQSVIGINLQTVAFKEISLINWSIANAYNGITKASRSPVFLTACLQQHFFLQFREHSAIRNSLEISQSTWKEPDRTSRNLEVPYDNFMHLRKANLSILKLWNCVRCSIGKMNKTKTMLCDPFRLNIKGKKLTEREKHAGETGERKNLICIIFPNYRLMNFLFS